MESIVNKGGRVVEEDVIRLIELLMNELIKLDGVVADGDVKQQRRNQVSSSLLDSLLELFKFGHQCIKQLP